ncbi:phospholipase D family protein [Isoptericola sp. 178]|uniref:phospholipase D family protein n=1 Tax=Isoptericola sp. 178 TaxID=3064651 RepID=UPI0027135D62|nr:phospholipase D family protein [Isoptericola sp. 178]MDO8144516.1 phospholipase D family protein [Isoptericola sp. 178]
MLTPQTRVMLTDALRPPAGYRVDTAVGTSYSLDLTALLLAPLSFALYDHSGDDVLAVDPVRLLEAVRRHTARTTVFCQAGGIHVPAAYRPIHTFVEDSVLEVMPPEGRTLFHPKVWALRFAGPDGAFSHRVVVLSRNLTFDRSWDTALVLDESDGGTIEAASAADFLRGLPGLALRELQPDRAAQVDDLATTLAQVSLSPPEPFTGGRLLPIGLADEPVWPFPEEARRLLAISPFLTRHAVRRLGALSTDRVLVSRPESLELIGSQALAGWEATVLQRLAEVEAGTDVDAPPSAPDEFAVGEGLHAKTFVLDMPRSQSMTVTGSANLTAAPWGRSVEFDAVLTGPTARCGVAATLDGSDEAPGLRRMLAEHAVSTAEGADDAAIETSYALEAFHRALAVGGPVLHVEPLDDERVRATLTLTLPDDMPGETRVWLASLPGDGQSRTLADQVEWTVAPSHVIPFVAVETTAGSGDARATRRCVIKADLTGAVDSRRQDAVASVLQSKADVLRYLVLLLGDHSYDALFAQLAGVDGAGFHDGSGQSVEDVALFEPLVRATGRDEDALARVASLVEELRELDRAEDLVPDGFDELWDVVWQVHQEGRA